MNGNRHLAHAKELKGIFDVLFGPGPYETDYISVEATGVDLEEEGYERPWTEILRFERDTVGGDVPAALTLNPDEDSWSLNCLDAIDVSVEDLPVENSDQLVMLVVSELAEAFATEVALLLAEIQKGSTSRWGPETLELVLERWWGLTHILEDFAHGKWANFDPYPESKAIERARIGLTSQVKWLNIWKERDLGRFIVSKKYFVAFLLDIKLPELEEFLDNPPNSPDQAPANQAVNQNQAKIVKPKVKKVPSAPPLNPNLYVKKQGLSTNAIAWIVALAIGAFIAIGAAMGY
jgi:hypothetical protein